MLACLRKWLCHEHLSRRIHIPGKIFHILSSLPTIQVWLPSKARWIHSGRWAGNLRTCVNHVLGMLMYVYFDKAIPLPSFFAFLQSFRTHRQIVWPDILVIEPAIRSEKQVVVVSALFVYSPRCNGFCVLWTESQDQ